MNREEISFQLESYYWGYRTRYVPGTGMFHVKQFQQIPIKSQRILNLSNFHVYKVPGTYLVPIIFECFT